MKLCAVNDSTVYRCRVCRKRVTESNFKWYQRPANRTRTSPQPYHLPSFLADEPLRKLEIGARAGRSSNLRSRKRLASAPENQTRAGRLVATWGCPARSSL